MIIATKDCADRCNLLCHIRSGHRPTITRSYFQGGDNGDDASVGEVDSLCLFVGDTFLGIQRRGGDSTVIM